VGFDPVIVVTLSAVRLEIYTVPVSLYCAKLRILLRHKQLEWRELPPPGGYGSDEYKELVPGGNLPALRHDDILISDSEAIAEYLNEAYPEPDMLPGSPRERAAIRNLSRFHDTRLEPALRRLFPHIRRPGEAKQEIADLWGKIELRFEQLARLLPDGPRELTLADCGLPVASTWIDLAGEHFGLKPPSVSKVNDYLGWVKKVDAVEVELTSYKPIVKKWFAG
jgi:glutathione S-transferase/maleylpyruvate isomerase